MHCNSCPQRPSDMGSTHTLLGESRILTLRAAHNSGRKCALTPVSNLAMCPKLTLTWAGHQHALSLAIPFLYGAGKPESVEAGERTKRAHCSGFVCGLHTHEEATPHKNTVREVRLSPVSAPTQPPPPPGEVVSVWHTRTANPSKPQRQPLGPLPPSPTPPLVRWSSLVADSALEPGGKT